MVQCQVKLFPLFFSFHLENTDDRWKKVHCILFSNVYHSLCSWPSPVSDHDECFVLCLRSLRTWFVCMVSKSGCIYMTLCIRTVPADRSVDSLYNFPPPHLHSRKTLRPTCLWNSKTFRKPSDFSIDFPFIFRHVWCILLKAMMQSCNVSNYLLYIWGSSSTL